ncbi:hypothetical protein LCGC14_0235980 [marine sediment metagenome]|uniref:Uncharacterized protein n=1 Tax=marine sediment metagenome TaxID=412755 RepID=A0A0F9UQF2_9ZZZZ
MARMTNERRKRRRRLRDLVIDEVSFVDRPANLTPFLFYKNADGMPVELDKADFELTIDFQSKGTPETTMLKVNGKKVTDPQSFHVSYWPIGTEHVSVVCEYVTENKGTSNGGFKNSTVHRLAKNDPKKLGKTEWTAKFVNDLPDGSFLYVEKGGKVDGEGKTLPRSLRHFPVRNAEGNIDLPHLRDAIAKISQENIPATKKKSLQAQARKMLEGAQRVTKAEQHDLEILSTLLGIEADPEMDGDLAKGLAEHAETINLYMDDLPQDAKDAMVAVIKLASETEEVEPIEIEVDKMSDETEPAVENTSEGNQTQTTEEPAKSPATAPSVDTAKLVSEITESLIPKVTEGVLAALDARQAAEDDPEIPDDEAERLVAEAMEEQVNEG